MHVHSRRHVHARVHVQANAPCILSIGQEGKATAHVDVALLAELAEEAGVDACFAPRTPDELYAEGVDGGFRVITRTRPPPPNSSSPARTI